MQSNDATEPSDVQELRGTLSEWAAISSRMIELLHETAGCERSRNWRPHVGQIVKAVHVFGERCRLESQQFGFTRAARLEQDDVLHDVREHGQRLVDWLQRMMPDVPETD
jgi:hypothetical protein